MKSALILTLFLAATGATLAGNARSDRTAYDYRQEQYRRQVLNQQWAAHLQRLRVDHQSAQQGYATNPDGSPSRTYQMRYQSHRYHHQWRQHAPRPQRIQQVTPWTSQRRR